MQIQLQQLLKYRNKNIISRYQSEYPHSKMTAQEALSELMKYIWLCHKHASDKKSNPENELLNFRCVIHEEMEEIDNMWHTFLLFTKNYQDFCNQYLKGHFFHHDPLPAKQRRISQKKYTQELHRYLSYIYDNLGEETLVKWFKEKCSL